MAILKSKVARLKKKSQKYIVKRQITLDQISSLLAFQRRQLPELKLIVYRTWGHFYTDVKRGLSKWPDRGGRLLQAIYLVARGGLKKQTGGGSLRIFALWINSSWPTWAVIEEFFIQLAPTIPWWAWACYFLMKPFSQPVV